MAIPLDRSPLSSAARATLILGLVAVGCNDPAGSNPVDGVDDPVEPRGYSPPPLPDVKLPAKTPGPGPTPFYMGGVVSTSEALASAMGRKALENGSDAIDAFQGRLIGHTQRIKRRGRGSERAAALAQRRADGEREARHQRGDH